MLTRARQLIKFRTAFRPFHTSLMTPKEEDTSKDVSGSVGTKFQVFRNETGVIFDIEEERRQGSEIVEESEAFKYNDFNLESNLINVKCLNNYYQLSLIFRRHQWNF